MAIEVGAAGLPPPYLGASLVDDWTGVLQWWEEGDASVVSKSADGHRRCRRHRSIVWKFGLRHKSFQIIPVGGNSLRTTPP